MDYSQLPAPTAREDVVENPAAPAVITPVAPPATLRELRKARAALVDAYLQLANAEGTESENTIDVDNLVFELDKVLRRNCRKA